MKVFIWGVITLSASFLYLVFNVLKISMPYVLVVFIGCKLVFENFPLNWFSVFISPITTYLLSYLFQKICAVIATFSGLYCRLLFGLCKNRFIEPFYIVCGGT